jgi:hypothetical protein
MGPFVIALMDDDRHYYHAPSPPDKTAIVTTIQMSPTNVLSIFLRAIHYALSVEAAPLPDGTPT